MEETWRKLRFKLYFWVFCLLKPLGVEEKNLIKKKELISYTKDVLDRPQGHLKERKFYFQVLEMCFLFPLTFRLTRFGDVCIEQRVL